MSIQDYIVYGIAITLVVVECVRYLLFLKKRKEQAKYMDELLKKVFAKKFEKSVDK